MQQIKLSGWGHTDQARPGLAWTLACFPQSLSPTHTHTHCRVTAFKHATHKHQMYLSQLGYVNKYFKTTLKISCSPFGYDWHHHHPHQRLCGSGDWGNDAKQNTMSTEQQRYRFFGRERERERERERDATVRPGALGCRQRSRLWFTETIFQDNCVHDLLLGTRATEQPPSPYRE